MIPSTTKVLGMMVPAGNPSIWEVEQANQKFRVGFGYVGSFRPVWNERNTVLSRVKAKL